MFAVKGWTLPTTAPVAQIDKKKAATAKRKSKSASDANSIPVAKRAEIVSAVETAPEIAITPDNVLAMYEKVIEGKIKAEAPRRRKRGERKKSKKTDGDGEGAEAEEEGSKKRAREDEGEDAAPRKKTLKEKRREKKIAAAAVEAGEDPVAAVAAHQAANPAPVPAPAHPDLADLISASPVPTKASTLTPLQQKMRAKLSSARFRHINETLYTTPSASSLDLFKTQPEMYSEYHTGFRQQVTQWPENPVDVFINQLNARAAVKFARGHSKRHLPSSTAVVPLPRDQETGICTVADLGCGDAKIAATFNTKAKKAEKIKVLSYDLQASTPQVTVADIANLPLEKESVDITVFCLALMGTNFLDFVDEAYRVLRWRGELWIAEIKSRFNRKGEAKGEVVDETEHELVDNETKMIREAAVYKNFVDALEKRGFSLRGKVDSANRMFVRMEFVKMPEREKRMEEDEEEDAAKQKQMKKQRMEKGKSKFIDGKEIAEKHLLKPCVYKLR